MLILQNSDETPPGTTLEWCEARGLRSVIIEVWNNQTFPPPQEVLGVVICGGGMNVDEEDKFPWLRNEKQFIKDLLQSKVKTLGLCLGAQLMAEVLGAKVQQHIHWEVGWHQVDLNAHGYLPVEISSLQFFQWHRYTFATPPGAIALGSSKGCANQAFAFERHGLAFQFHPESSPEWIRECAVSDPADYPKGPFVESSDEILRHLDRQTPMQHWYWQVLDRFFLEGHC